MRSRRVQLPGTTDIGAPRPGRVVYGCIIGPEEQDLFIGNAQEYCHKVPACCKRGKGPNGGTRVVEDYSVIVLHSLYYISTIIVYMEGSDLFGIILNGLLMIRRPAINIIEADD